MPFGQTVNELVSGRLANKTSNIKILNKIGTYLDFLIQNFQVKLKCFFTPKKLKSENSNA